MFTLNWDETDFLYCLEVTPTIEDDGLEFHYEVKNGGLILFVTVIPYRRLVTFSLFQESNTAPLTAFSLLVVHGVNLKKDKRGEYLRFNHCRFITEPDYYEDEAQQNTESYIKSFDLTVELFVKPHIRIRFE